jgi:hypothetical protein
MLFVVIKQFLFLFFAAILASIAFADSVTLISTADTAIAEKWPNNNTGGNDTFVVGSNIAGQRSHGLIKFNFSPIPANASIQSVSLTLTIVGQPYAPASATFDLHRMLISWGEGTGTSSADSGRLAVAGESTWNARLYPSTAWSAVGAAAPVDFSSTVSASAFAPVTPGPNPSPTPPYTATFASTPALVADVRQWLTDPTSNFGWIIIPESEATKGTHRNSSSRESAANDKPRLVVQYVIPVTPIIKSFQKSGSAIQFTFAALAGQPYTAEYRDSLVDGGWFTLANIPPQSSNTDVPVTDPTPPPTRRFYRITTTF